MLGGNEIFLILLGEVCVTEIQAFYLKSKASQEICHQELADPVKNGSVVHKGDDYRLKWLNQVMLLVRYMLEIIPCFKNNMEVCLFFKKLR